MSDWNTLLALPYPAMLAELFALPAAQQKRLNTWLKATWKSSFGALKPDKWGNTREIDAQEADQWMRFYVGHAAVHPQPKPAFVAPIRALDRLLWQTHGELVHTPIEARAALANAVVQRGPAHAQAYVDAHTRGVRALPQYPEVLLAIIAAHALPLPNDPLLVRKWARQLDAHWPRPNLGHATRAGEPNRKSRCSERPRLAPSVARWPALPSRLRRRQSGRRERPTATRLRAAGH